MLFSLYKIGRAICLLLPVNISYCLADILGTLYYWLVKRDREVLCSNLRVVLKARDNTPRVRHISRMVFKNFGRYLVDFFRTPKIDLAYVEKYIKIEGRENLDKALSLGKGVLLVSAHLGNWELGGMVLAMLGYKVNVIVWTHKDKRVNDFFIRQRESKGLKAIPLGMSIRNIFSILKRNGMVGFLGDIDYLNPTTGIKVEFFGQDAIMPKGPAAFSLKATCPIVPIFMLRKKGPQFKLILEEPVIYRPRGDWEYDLRSLTAKVTKTMEHYIGQYPGQWFMLTSRWQNNI